MIKAQSFEVLCDNGGSFKIAFGGRNSGGKERYGAAVVMVRCNREDTKDNERGLKLAAMIAEFLNRDPQAVTLLREDMKPS